MTSIQNFVEKNDTVTFDLVLIIQVMLWIKKNNYY